MKYMRFKGIEFLSSMDEELFFTWLGKIECISEILGEEDEIKISITQKVSDLDLRELIAVTYRYNADMTQLRALLSNENRVWFFENPDSYWHEKVF